MSLKRGWRIAAWMLGALMLLVGAAWLAVPPLARWLIERQGSETLGRPLTVGEVSFAPRDLSFTLRDLRMAGTGGAPEQLSVARLHVDLDLRSLWYRAPVLEAIEVDAPKLRLARLAPGRWDIDDLVARFGTKPDAPPSEPARFALFNLRVSGGEVEFDDRPVRQRHRASAIELGVPFVSNLPAHVEVKVQPRLALTSDAARLDLQGTALPFAPEPTSELKLGLDAFALSRLWPYLPQDLPLRLQGGVLDADLALRFAQPRDQAPRIALAGSAALTKLAAQDRAGAPLAGFDRLQVAIEDLRPLDRVAALGRVALESPAFDLRRRADGSLDLPTAPTAVQPDKPAPPWKVSVAAFQLSAGQLRWRDAAARADFDAEDLALRAEKLRWPAEAMVPVQASATLKSAGREVATLKLAGQASDREAKLEAELGAVDLSAAAPYLRNLLRPPLAGRAALKAGVDWAAGDMPRLALAIESLGLESLRLGTGRQPPLSIASLLVEDSTIDLVAQRAAIGRVRAARPSLALARDADGRIDAASWFVAAAQTGEPADKSSPWRATVADLRIEGGALRLTDASARTAEGAAAEVAFDAINLGVQQLAWPSGAPAKVQAALRVPARDGAPPGRLEARADVSLEPLSARGNAKAERVPVHAFEPWFGAALPVLLRRAELGWQGRFDLKQQRDAIALDTQGDLLLADLRVQERRGEQRAEGGEELLAWQSLTLKPLAVKLAPGAKPSVEIGEAVLSNFFSKLVITEQGRFNLRDVQGAAAPEGAASAAPAPATATAQGLPIDLLIGGVKLVEGRIDFTDRFIRPNYSAALSELNGTLGRFSSANREMATLDLRGRAAGTALLEVRGAINPTADPLALDIQARASDLELAPFSPYSAKYAGYGIERGKLSMDVSYRIDADGKLDAKNQLVLNQLTFGEKVDSPDATKLPVRLAVALLTDRNGVIDINLPISGSINDPQFSVFGLVLRIIGNLLVKALTAPFALLAGSGTEDLSLVEFEPGTARIAAASTPVVEKVAKALGDRPALRMTVTGAADPVSEADAMRAADLEARLRTEQQRDRARAGQAGQAGTELPPLTAEERAALVRRLYSETKLPNKPRNLIGLAKDIPVAEMEALLKGAVLVSTDSARDLALKRGLAVRDALVTKGLPAERLFLGAPKLRASGEDDAKWSPRVQLVLQGP